MFRIYVRLTGIVILLMLAINITQAQAADLFISEYIEGANGGFNNQAIEIYNGTGATVNLSGYSLELYPNGVPSPSVTFNLAGTLANGDVYVVARTSAVPEILTVADVLNDGITSFDGDDALVLRKITGNVDIIGRIGEDPGTEWGTGLTSTQNNTLVRKPAICQGDNLGSDAFDPATQWNGFAQDTVIHLGSHTSDCLPANTATPTSTSTNTTVPPTATPTATVPGSTATATDTPVDETPVFTPTDTLEATATSETPVNTATSTLEATATSTATGTPATAVPTATEQTAGIELLINGGMELDENANDVPDGWKGQNKTKDKIKCNKPDKPVARTGNCAFLFKGGANEKSKLSQKVILDGLTFALGDELNLILYVNALKSAAKGKIKLAVKYADAEKSKAGQNFAQTSGYEEIVGQVTIASLNIVAIKVQFDHRSPSGKLFVDDVSLKWVSSLR